MRKLISILLCACLLFSFAMLSATAAEEGDDVLKNAKWVLGQYDYSTGKFIEYNSRIAAEDKLSVNPGDEFSFDTGCDDDGVSFVLRGYDSADNFDKMHYDQTFTLRSIANECSCFWVVYSGDSYK